MLGPAAFFVGMLAKTHHCHPSDLSTDLCTHNEMHGHSGSRILATDMLYWLLYQLLTCFTELLTCILVSGSPFQLRKSRSKF
jgi:hypothetical protein